MSKLKISLYDWCFINNRKDLLDEWDYEKNEINPKDISFGNDKKVWWRKEYNDPHTKKHFTFSWDASVSHRTTGNRGCPYLSVPVKRIMVGFNDLNTLYPKIAAEWNYELNTGTPEDFSVGSTYVANWICELGHQYQSRISSRVDGQGCPYCAGKKVLVGFNDLETTHPLIAKQWDYNKNNSITPKDVSKGCTKKFYWLCDKGHSFLSTVNNRTSEGIICPICTGRQVLIGYNDLATTEPNLAKEWDYEKNSIRPTEVTRQSNLRIWWKCQYGHRFNTMISTRATYGTGCNICYKERKSSLQEKTIYYYVKKYYDDAIESYTNKELGRREIDVYIPSLNIGIEYDGANWHKDKNKDLNKDKLCSNIGIMLYRIRDDRCPTYDSNSVKFYYGKSSYLKDLKSAIEALFEMIDSSLKLDIDIDRDNSEIMELYVSYKKNNSLLALYPDIAKEWSRNNKITPDMVTPGSNKKVLWLCPFCGKEYLRTVNHKVSRNNGCNQCKSIKKKTGD